MAKSPCPVSKTQFLEKNILRNIRAMSSNTRTIRTWKAAVAGVSLSPALFGYSPMAEAKRPDDVPSSMNASKPSAADRKLVNARDQDGIAPITYAAAEGNVAEVRRMIALGADVNAKGKDGVTPLLFAITAGKYEVAKLLMENKADVNAKKPDNGLSPLMLVAGKDTPLTQANANMEVAELLIAHKADLNARDKQGRTALIYAATRGNEVIANLLVGSEARVKANANLKDRNGRTALMEAASDGKAKILQLLLTYGKANIDIKDKQGRTALMEAAANLQIIAARILLADHADVNALDKQGRTALSLVPSMREKMTEEDFLSFGIPFSHPEENSVNTQMAELLRSYGAE